MSEYLLMMAAIYSGFCALDVAQHLSVSYFAVDALVVTMLLALAGQTGEWIL